jgi:hypothetical protein
MSEPEMPTHEPTRPPEIRRSALVGALSGLTVAMISLVGSSQVFDYLAVMSTGVIVGLALRFVVLMGLGALGAVLNQQGDSGQSFLATFQLGMVGPFFVTNLTLQTAISQSSPAPNPSRSSQLGEGIWTEAYRVLVAADSSPSQQLARGAGIPLSGDAFPLVFSCLMGLTLFSAIISVYLGTKGDNTQRMNSLIETYSTTWKMGFGALVGLLSGKAFS